MRCKCCDNRLNYGELKATKEDGTPEDLCSGCQTEAFDDSYEYTYLFEGIREGVTQPKKVYN